MGGKVRVMVICCRLRYPKVPNFMVEAQLSSHLTIYKITSHPDRDQPNQLGQVVGARWTSYPQPQQGG